jgi:hypothetical protein
VWLRLCSVLCSWCDAQPRLPADTHHPTTIALRTMLSPPLHRSLKLKEMYQMITLGGDAELELVDTFDPFSEVGGGGEGVLAGLGRGSGVQAGHCLA